MRRFLSIAASAGIFALVGPAIGAVVAFVSRGEIRPDLDLDDVLLLLLMSYGFGIAPALIAGAIYGAVRLRVKDSRWHARAFHGAGAGLIGCLICVIPASIYTLATAHLSTLHTELPFYRLMVVASVIAGAACALSMGPRRSPA